MHGLFTWLDKMRHRTVRISKHVNIVAGVKNRAERNFTVDSRKKNLRKITQWSRRAEQEDDISILPHLSAISATAAKYWGEESPGIVA